MVGLSWSYLKISKILGLTNCHKAHQVSNGLLFLLSARAKIVMLALLLFIVVKIKGELTHSLAYHVLSNL